MFLPFRGSLTRILGLLVLIFLLLSVNILPARELVWATAAGGEGDQWGQRTAIGPNGEVVVTGRFTGTIHFGEGQQNETVFTADENNFCFFVAKYDSDGVFQWARQIVVFRRTGYPWNSQVPNAAFDRSGNIDLTAVYLSSVDLSKDEPDAVTLNAVSGSADFFVAQYSPDGGLNWALSEGGEKDDGETNLAVDGKGNVFLVGSFLDSVAFGKETSHPAELVSTGAADICVAKYDSEGNFLWAQSGGGKADDAVKGATADADGNVIITGQVTQDAIFGKGQPNQVTLPGFGEEDILIAKYSAQGDFLWAKGIGNAFIEAGMDVATDSENNIVATGYFTRSAIFGEDTLSTPYSWADRFFLAKFDPDGNSLWARQSTGDMMSNVQGLCVDVFKNGDILAQAFLMFTAHFGQSGSYDTTITAIPDTGGMVQVIYSAQGDFLSAQNVSDWGYSAEYAEIDLNDRVIQTGRFTENITFGEGESAVELENRGGADMFVAKFGDVVTGMTKSNNLPRGFRLLPNYPNPFNQSTTIAFYLDQAERVLLRIYDIRGREVATLINKTIPRGWHKIRWRGQYADGTEAATGLYFGELQTEQGKRFIKMVLMR